MKNETTIGGAAVGGAKAGEAAAGEAAANKTATYGAVAGGDMVGEGNDTRDGSGGAPATRDARLLAERCNK